MPAPTSTARKNAKGGMNSMPMRPRRRRVEQTPEMIRANLAMIADHLKNGGAVTVCPPAYAMGSLKSTAFGLDV